MYANGFPMYPFGYGAAGAAAYPAMGVPVSYAGGSVPAYAGGASGYRQPGAPAAAGQAYAAIPHGGQRVPTTAGFPTDGSGAFGGVAGATSNGLQLQNHAAAASQAMALAGAHAASAGLTSGDGALNFGAGQRGMGPHT